MLEFARGESRRRRRAASFHWLGELPICVVILQEFLRGLTGSRAAAAAHSGRRAGGKEGEKRASGRAAEEEEEAAAAAGQPQSRAALCRRAARSGAPTAAERNGPEGARGPAPRPRALPSAAAPLSPLCPATGGRRAGSAGRMRCVWLALTLSFVACASGQPVSERASGGAGGRDGTGRGRPSGLRPQRCPRESSRTGAAGAPLQPRVHRDAPARPEEVRVRVPPAAPSPGSPQDRPAPVVRQAAAEGTT